MTAIKAAVIVNAVLVSVLLGRWLLKPSKQPPFKHGLPVFGCVVSYFLNPVKFLQGMRDRWGGIFGFNLAGRNIVLLVDNKAISSYYKVNSASLGLYYAITSR